MSPVSLTNEIARLRREKNAVILAHNHPSGLALPSEEDYHTTLRIASALRAVGIELRDHIIVADEDFISMADSGVFLS